MPAWYEIFENEDVQIRARRQGARLGIMMTATIVVLSLCYYGLAPREWVVISLACAWTAMAHYTCVHMRRLRRVFWCVKVCDRRIIGYDYARHKTVLEWDRVRRIELSSEGLTVVGPQTLSLTIPSAIIDFSRLSHRIVDHAEQIGVPVFIDGQPWQNVDVYALFPVLADQGAHRARH